LEPGVIRYVTQQHCAVLQDLERSNAKKKEHNMDMIGDALYPHFQAARLAGKKGQRILEFLDWLQENYPGVALPEEKENLLMRYYGVDIDGYHRDRAALTEAFNAGVKAIAQRQAEAEPKLIVTP
jgi:hypothetical protein